MKFDTELLVGWTVLGVLGVLVYMSLQFGQVSFAGNPGYEILADFSDAGGLQSGARVELAGVEIGRVNSVALTSDLTKAHVSLTIQPDIPLPQDSRAAIKTAGLIGERYIDIEPGVAEERLAHGGQIRQTESPVDILDLIGQALFGNFGATGQQDTTPADEEHPWDLGLN